MNDTPETDGEWNRLACQDHPEFERNLADFARKMERERDEWQINALLKLAVKQLACMWCGEIVHAPTGYEPGTPLSEEQRGQAYREHVATCQKHPIRDVERERDKLRAWTSVNGVSQLAQERDAAIAELEAWRSEKGPEGWWVKHGDHMAQLELWRDEKAGLKDMLENTIAERDQLKRNYDHERELHWQTLEKYRMHHEEAERLNGLSCRIQALYNNMDPAGFFAKKIKAALDGKLTTHAPPSQPASSPSNPPASSADA